MTCARNWRLLLTAQATKARNLNLLAESELALAINFYAVSFLNWKKSGLKNAPSLTSRHLAGTVGIKD